MFNYKVIYYTNAVFVDTNEVFDDVLFELSRGKINSLAKKVQSAVRNRQVE